MQLASLYDPLDVFWKRIAKLWDSIPTTGRFVGGILAIVGIFLAFILGPSGKTCADAGGLRHVYLSSRLLVLAKCQTIRYQVVAWRLEHDGDVHVNGKVLGDGTWVNPGNVRGQHGLTVVEFVPEDPRPPGGFRVGMVLELQTTKVEDLGHSVSVGGTTWHWIEGHPVFSVKVIADGTGTPNPTRLAPATENG